MVLTGSDEQRVNNARQPHALHPSCDLNSTNANLISFRVDEQVADASSRTRPNTLLFANTTVVLRYLLLYRLSERH